MLYPSRLQPRPQPAWSRRPAVRFGGNSYAFESRQITHGEACVGTLMNINKPHSPLLFVKKDEAWIIALEARVLEQVSARSKRKIAPDLLANLIVSTNNEYAHLVTEVLGKNLYHLHAELGRFSLNTIAAVAAELLQVFEALHECDYIHRDVRPENIVVDPHDPSKLYLVDFAYAREWRTGSLIRPQLPHPQSDTLIGTVTWASLQSHRHRTLSRRDDLISLGLILLYFVTGDLPWYEESSWDDVYAQKVTWLGHKLDVLCANAPVQYYDFMVEVLDLKYSETIDYDRWQETFTGLHTNSEPLDWANMDVSI